MYAIRSYYASFLCSWVFWKRLYPDSHILNGDANITDIDWISRDNPYRIYWQDHVRHEPCQRLEVLLLHAEARHLLDPHSNPARLEEARVITSYSIHYTKLYDAFTNDARGRFGPPTFQEAGVLLPAEQATLRVRVK